MNLLASDSLAPAMYDVGAAACFRSLAVVGYLLFSRRVRIVSKIAIGLGYVTVAVAVRAWSLPALAWLCVGYAYFAAVAAAGSFLVVPCLLVPNPARTTTLVLGWDMMLSSYSYCVEAAKTTEDPPLRECLFFLLVNPALVYARRGARVGDPAVRLPAVGRGIAGLATLFVAAAFLTPVCAAIQDGSLEAPLLRAPLTAAAAYGLTRFFVEYARQSGLASLQIGLLHQLGHRIPERYRWPVAAKDPLDFWRRWNTYVSGWLLLYVFWPVANALRGAGGGWRLRAAQAGGIVATFVVAGALHDACMYAVAFDAAGRSMRAFSLVGAVVCSWVALAWVWRRLTTAAAIGGRLAQALGIVSRISFITLVVACVAWGWS
jgi:hypothetical protein